MEAFGIFGVLLALLGVVIAVLWVFMPFAIFGLKDLTRDLIREQRRTNDLLEKLTTQRSSGT
jgi:predicted PurR-regulated permease PerM